MDIPRETLCVVFGGELGNVLLYAASRWYCEPLMGRDDGARNQRKSSQLSGVPGRTGGDNAQWAFARWRWTPATF